VQANRDNEHMVRSLIDLSGKFNLKTVAEWVESPADAEALAGWGIDYLQGNYIGEASIIAPWTKVQESRFEVNADPTFEVQAQNFFDATVELSSTQFAEPEALEAQNPEVAEPIPAQPVEMADVGYTESWSTDVEPAANANTFEFAPQTAAIAELDFSELDHSIANLRAALDDLNKARAAPPTEPEDATATRDAA